jgi:sortase (surface protein transpeptidase)
MLRLSRGVFKGNMQQDQYIHSYYQDYQDYQKPLFPGFGVFVAKILVKTAKILAVSGMLFVLVSYGPSLWFLLSQKVNISGAVSKALAFRNPNKSKIETIVSDNSQKNVYQPRTDLNLPLENMLIIPAIGVKTNLNEAGYDNLEGALKKGVWRVPDYGTPYSRDYPTILAAHRYGYLKWSVAYRLKNSFYNLPKLGEGDVVEVVWRQRKYIYEVYATSEGEEISDYSADLILYTCEALNSPIRVFKYARLLTV